MKPFIIGFAIGIFFIFSSEISSSTKPQDEAVTLVRIEKELKKTNSLLQEIRDKNNLIAEKLLKF